MMMSHLKTMARLKNKQFPWKYLYHRGFHYGMATCMPTEQVEQIKKTEAERKQLQDKRAELKSKCTNELTGDDNRCLRYMKLGFEMTASQLRQALLPPSYYRSKRTSELIGCVPNTPILALNDEFYSDFVSKSLVKKWIDKFKSPAMFPMQQLLIGAMIHRKDIIVHAKTQTGKTTAICFEAIRAAKYWGGVKGVPGIKVIIACQSKLLVSDIIKKFGDFLSDGEWNVKLVGSGKLTNQEGREIYFSEINNDKSQKFRKATGQNINYEIAVGTLASIRKENIEPNNVIELIVDEADHFLGNSREGYGDREYKFDILSKVFEKYQSSQYALISATFDYQARERAIGLCIANHGIPPQVLLTQELVPENLKIFKEQLATNQQLVEYEIKTEAQRLDFRLFKLLELYQKIQSRGKMNIIAFVNNPTKLKASMNMAREGWLGKRFKAVSQKLEMENFLLAGDNAEERDTFIKSDYRDGYLYLAQSDEAKGIDFPCRISVVLELPDVKDPGAFNAIIHKLGRASNVGYRGVGILMYFEDEQKKMASLMDRNQDSNLDPIKYNQSEAEAWLKKPSIITTCGDESPDKNAAFYASNKIPKPSTDRQLEILEADDDDSLLFKIKQIFKFNPRLDQSQVLVELRKIAQRIEEGGLVNPIQQGRPGKMTLADVIKIKQRPTSARSTRSDATSSDATTPSDKPAPSSYAEAVDSSVSQAQPKPSKPKQAQSLETLGHPEEEVVFNDKVTQQTKVFFLGKNNKSNIYVKKTEAQKKSIPKLYKNDRVTFRRVLDVNGEAINGRVEIISVEHTGQPAAQSIDRRLTGVVKKVGKSASGWSYLIITVNKTKFYYKMKRNDKFKVGDRVRFHISNSTIQGSLPTAYNLTKE